MERTRLFVRLFYLRNHSTNFRDTWDCVIGSSRSISHVILEKSNVSETETLCETSSLSLCFELTWLSARVIFITFSRCIIYRSYIRFRCLGYKLSCKFNLISYRSTKQLQRYMKLKWNFIAQLPKNIESLHDTKYTRRTVFLYFNLNLLVARSSCYCVSASGTFCDRYRSKLLDFFLCL